MSRSEISLLLPTRGRVQMLQRLFDSLVATADGIETVEVILYIDEDDMATQAVDHPMLRLVRLVKPPRQPMGRMNQQCYEASTGRYVMLINDDVVARTRGWDRRIKDSFGKFPDEIALVYGNDLYQGEALSTMPVLSRRVCELIGGVCPQGYHNTYIDLHLFDLFKKLAKLGQRRLVYHGDLIFEHLHHEAGKASLDATYVKANEESDDRLFINLEEERWKQARMLKRHIESLQTESAPPTTRRSVGARFKQLFSYGKS